MEYDKEWQKMLITEDFAIFLFKPLSIHLQMHKLF